MEFSQDMKHLFCAKYPYRQFTWSLVRQLLKLVTKSQLRFCDHLPITVLKTNVLVCCTYHITMLSDTTPIVSHYNGAVTLLDWSE